jgi:precorrin-2 dehydrogenase/sirohydrochlorin ferrochelatase
MQYYPVSLRVAGRACVVIGGGSVAERKVVSLRNADARVTVISLSLTATLQSMVDEGLIAHRRRAYQNGDLQGYFLAYAATGKETVNASIASEAAAAGVLLNVVDRPQLCTFIVPSVMARGDLTVAVSTAGGSPALARRVRRTIEAALGPEYERALTVLARLRERLRRSAISAADRQRIFNSLVESDLLDCLRVGDAVGVDALLARYVGVDYTLASLGMGVEQ